MAGNKPEKAPSFASIEEASEWWDERSGDYWDKAKEVHFDIQIDKKPLHKIYKQFQTAYKELTGNSIDWRDIPENLQNSLRTFQPLSVKEFIKLPQNIRMAYFASHKSPDNVVLNKIKKRLAFYENKYGITSEDFYRKYHNSESLYEGSPEQVCDFLLWHGDYRRYLELKNAIR
ncbi:hypothetical protein FJZ31_23070 [Candidatus Poribacteria bacterium]|nr:hypothetical protein [Candidatus Poribacteria bacterium]